ncbi:hypothetical protein BY458DRAFT_452862 [Sporodiniella umbellata]|nr:hypothetical protein BY458DRAFT_452862 [Sporodiniella umbellata]
MIPVSFDMSRDNAEESTGSDLKYTETKRTNSANAWKDWAEEQTELNVRQITPRQPSRERCTTSRNICSFTKEQFKRAFPSPSLCFCRKPAYRSHTQELGPVLECGNYQVVLDHSKVKTKYVCSFHVHEISWEKIKNRIFEEKEIDVDLPELRDCPHYNFTFCTTFHLFNDYLQTLPSAPLCFCNQPTILRVANRGKTNDLSCAVELSCKNYDSEGAKPKCCWKFSAKDVAFPRPERPCHALASKREFKKTVSPTFLQARTSPLSFSTGHKNELLSTLLSPGRLKSPEICPTSAVTKVKTTLNDETPSSSSSSLSKDLSTIKPALLSTVRPIKQPSMSPVISEYNQDEQHAVSEKTIHILNNKIERLEMSNKMYREKYQASKTQTRNYQMLMSGYQDESEKDNILRIECQERLDILEVELVKMMNENQELSQKLTTLTAEESREERRCIVCFNQPVEYALAPCFHFAYCLKCSSKLEECAICRQPITDIHKIFQS